MDRDSVVAVKVTQSAFVVRLLAIAAAMVASLGHQLDLPASVGYLVAGVTSYVGLTRTNLLHQVTKHPSIALADVVLVAGATAVGGSRSPFILVVLTTALLLGLWVDVLPGSLVIVSLMGLYLLGLTKTVPATDDILLFVVVVPFVYFMLWFLSITLRRALAAQVESNRVLRDAVATAAAAEERSSLARELHDSVAKSLQGLMLTASSLPVYLDRDPARARELAGEIQAMAGQSVHELRGLMGQMRERTSEQPLGDAMRLVVVQWQARTGRETAVHIDEGLDTRDEAVRYELLAVLQEALDNVHRHAGTASVKVSATATGDRLVLEVHDDGVGAEPLHVEAAARAGHFGVKGFHERLARVGGQAVWDSVPGRGTIVRCSVHREGLIER